MASDNTWGPKIPGQLYKSFFLLDSTIREVAPIAKPKAFLFLYCCYGVLFVLKLWPF